MRTNAERLEGDVTPIIDPLELDRALVPYRRGIRTLAALCPAYSVPLPADTHQAHVDAQIALRLLAAMVAEHPELASLPTEDLDAFHRDSHARWARDLQAWHASQGRDRKISPVWF